MTHILAKATMLACLASTLLTSGALFPATAARASTTNHGDRALRRALQKYLSTQGNVCVGKFTWPIDVKEADFRVGARNAVQMPVLEKLGLVRSTDATVQQIDDDVARTVAVKRYELTDTGRRFYISKDASARGPAGADVEYHKDLCAIRLTLDKIVRWEEAPASGTVRQGTLYYTYHASPAEWIRAPEARRVFPLLDRILEDEGSLQLQQRMRLEAGGWVAVGVE